MPERGVFGQGRDGRGDQCPGGPEAFVVARLLRDGREHAGQVRPGVPDPPGFGGISEQLLRHRIRRIGWRPRSMSKISSYAARLRGLYLYFTGGDWTVRTAGPQRRSSTNNA
jgi:hypothetical protein